MRQPLVLVFLLAAPGLPSFPAATAPPSLSLAERVEAARALKQVEWDETLWPAHNPGPKPAQDAVVPEAVIRREAEDALLKSAALARFWGRPVTPAQLQAEIDRMVAASRRPSALQARFASLGRDPLRIAECLARPLLADRLLRNWYGGDERFHGALRQRIEGLLAAFPAGEDLRSLGGTYSEAAWRAGEEKELATAAGDEVLLPPETWQHRVARLAEALGVDDSTADGAGIVARLPLGRPSRLIETGDSFAVQEVLAREPGKVRVATVSWPKVPFDEWWETVRGDLLADGGLWLDLSPVLYDIPRGEAATCTPDTWKPTGQEVPDRRYYHSAVWTGSAMIIWGGFNEVNNTDTLNTGALYNPGTDTWTPTATGPNTPTKRMRHSAVWTGTEMIVWGGSYDGGLYLNTGSRYNPLTNSWTALRAGSALPAARDRHTAVWTGGEMIVWGGYGVYGPVNTGGLYCPATEAWVSTPTTGAPAARYRHTAVWTGKSMIVWGGYTTTYVNTGGRFNPVDGTWAATSTGTNVPNAREQHSAVWTGTEMIVWGGIQSTTLYATGGRYNPVSDSWTATSVSNAPAARNAHTAVWTGTEMIVWGGVAWTYPNYNTGGRYNPATDSWAATAVANAPAARQAHTAVWTGAEMIVWGGKADDMTNTGGRYAPGSDSWVPTSLGNNAPAARFWHVAVWTGSRMIVWGGYDDLVELNSGGRYDPATASWARTSTGANVPGKRRNFTAVWSGTEMIVWGGWPGTSPALNTGGRYNPLTDSWTATSTTGAPTGRNDHTAVWAGGAMIVWGGYPLAGLTNTGGRYDPLTNTWSATSVGTNVPSARRYHTAVWTGTEMIVWGGATTTSGTTTNSGGRYNLALDSWLPTSTGTNVPGAASRHNSVWSGTEMIEWGGGTPNGGRYSPAGDTWLPVSGTSSPGLRTNANAEWTGSEMIVWGGWGHLNTGARYNPQTNTWIPTGTGPDTPGGRSYHTGVWTGPDDAQMIVWGGEPVSASGGLYCGRPCAAATFYKDIDGDGFGTVLYTTTGCTPPPGYVDNSADCADADANNFPGNTEVCDGFDNDCDFVVDTDAVIPAGVPSLVLWRYGSAAEISWPVVPGADRYDLGKGWMSTLRGSGGDFSASMGACSNDLVTRRIGDPQAVPAGDGMWFLVRAQNCKGNGTWDDGGPGQSGSRDAGMAASPYACP